MVLDAYAVDHGGHYPDGHSSTEIFQKLMDEKYVTDSSIFYRVIPGEISPNTPQLKAADICWDLTLVPIDPAGPRIPLVYTTGFKIDFKPRGSATSLKPFSPSFNLAFAHWWDSAKNPTEHITMAYSDNSSTNVPLTREGTAPNIIPADFDPKGKTYHQLTPDGELPP